jgi:fructose-bisphosphate aldolase class I
MDKNILEQTAKKMMTLPKGILAMDESSPTIAKRLESIDTENNEINRRRYRELIVTTPELSSYISGVILFEETFDQKMSDGTLFRDYLNSIGILKIFHAILMKKSQKALTD